MQKYPALSHAKRLIRRMLEATPSTGPAYHYVILHGSNTKSRDDTDRELAFRQESNFYWLSGCDVPGSVVTISYLHDGKEFNEDKVTNRLSLPAVIEEEVMWCGLPPSPPELARKLEITTIESGWTKASVFPRSPAPDTKVYVHTLPWTPFDASIVSTINGPTHTTRYLISALHESRRTKDSVEIDLMSRAAEITKGAHELLMRAVGSGEIKDENEAEAVFVAHCRKHGAKHQAYMPIVGSGLSSGTLHYIANDATFPASGSLLLVDAGCEINNYASDITRCIPIGNGGRFTKECKEIYELVLEMQESAFAIIKPGTQYEVVQKLMHDILARGFLKLGIFQRKNDSASDDDNVKALVQSGLTSAFYPHGVGHLLGLDVHDAGGLPNGKSNDPLLKYLRLIGVPLEPGFVVTVEPGIYFNPHLFSRFSNSPLVNHEIHGRYQYVGGVRIEDNLLITEGGFQNLTNIAKTVQEVEALTAR